MLTSREHAWRFGHSFSRPVNTGSVYRRLWLTTSNKILKCVQKNSQTWKKLCSCSPKGILATIGDGISSQSPAPLALAAATRKRYSLFSVRPWTSKSTSWQQQCNRQLVTNKPVCTPLIHLRLINVSLTYLLTDINKCRRILHFAPHLFLVLH